MQILSPSSVRIETTEIKEQGLSNPVSSWEQRSVWPQAVANSKYEEKYIC